MKILGYTVWEAQDTEATIHVSMSVLFGLSEMESVEKLKDVYARKTLGQFLALLRKRIGLSSAFDRFLLDYIEQRNFIVHNLSRTSIFVPYDERGREKLTNLLMAFRQTNRKIHLTFIALTEVWMRKLGASNVDEKRLQSLKDAGLLEEIERDFIPNLSAMFRQNSST